MKSDKNAIYWSYNIPLQVWPVREDADDDSDKTFPITDYRIVNYMPRKERCEEVMLSDLLGEMTREEYMNEAAKYFDNLAKLFREAAKDPDMYIYYHDQDM